VVSLYYAAALAAPGTMARAEAMHSPIASQADILVPRFMAITPARMVEAVLFLFCRPAPQS